VFNSEDLDKLNDGRVSPDMSCGEGQMDAYQFYGKIPISLIKEVWIDEKKLDLLRIYFIGMIHSINKHRSFKIQTNFEEISEEILNVAEHAYEELSEFYMENYDSIESLTKKSLKQILLEVFGNSSLEQWIKRK
jgi:hypothetical protein